MRKTRDGASAPKGRAIKGAVANGRSLTKTAVAKPEPGVRTTPTPEAETKEIKNEDPSSLSKLQKLGGSQYEDWNNVLGQQVLSALWLKNSNENEIDQKIGAAVVAMIGIGPKDEVEGMIAAQMLACHNAAMECYKRAMISGQFVGRQENLNQANKLSRTHAALVEALNRHRGKGQQKVTVEHVHVHSGGQAIVGNVESPGGGCPTESGGQPHAVAYAPGIEVPGANSQRPTMPGTGDAERPLPDARRTVAGGAER
jgi:hypothetical protein